MGSIRSFQAGRIIAPDERGQCGGCWQLLPTRVPCRGQPGGLALRHRPRGSQPPAGTHAHAHRRNCANWPSLIPRGEYKHGCQAYAERTHGHLWQQTREAIMSGQQLRLPRGNEPQCSEERGRGGHQGQPQHHKCTKCGGVQCSIRIARRVSPTQ